MSLSSRPSNKISTNGTPSPYGAPVRLHDEASGTSFSLLGFSDDHHAVYTSASLARFPTLLNGLVGGTGFVYQSLGQLTVASGAQAATQAPIIEGWSLERAVETHEAGGKAVPVYIARSERERLGRESLELRELTARLTRLEIYNREINRPMNSR